MSQSNYLVIDGICNATGYIQCEYDICHIRFSICSGSCDGCTLWLLDGISASHGLRLSNLTSQQEQVELQLNNRQLQDANIKPLRAGLCLTKDGVPVAQGFPGGVHFPSIPFFEQASLAYALPPFVAHFGHCYHLDFSITTYSQLPIQGKCQTLIEQDEGLQYCCKHYGGCYYHQMDDAILIGIPWMPSQDPLPLLSLLPVQAFLPALQANAFGCVLLGIFPDKDCFFPIIFR